jgi:hypothetical protein
LHNETEAPFSFTALTGGPLVARAQSTFGSIVGVTQDTNAATIPGTTITIRNLDENVSYSAASNSEGGFQFLNLKPGRYEVTATKDGFANFKIDEVSLVARQTLRVEVKFQLAAIGASVNITADTVATINTESGMSCRSAKASGSCRARALS